MPSSFFVHRDNLAETVVETVDALVPAPGEVVISIERFALTANNITYGVAGDLIGYWNFFPAPEGMGRIPVWGIGKVTQSAHPDIAEGSRYYGYFPMSEELCVKPEKVNERGFKDGVAHRSELPPVYNQYSLVRVETGFDPAYENHAMVYRPLFTTSFVIDDYLSDNDFFGANTVIVGSASSKTGFGLAYMLSQRSDIKVVGLTSKTNSEFVEGLGLYDRVLTYDEVENLDQALSAYVDMAGNREVLARVHRHLGDQLVCSCGVGITHWDAREGEDPATLPGAKPTMFFAPSQIMKRNEAMGPEKYQLMIGTATQAFFQHVDDWVTIETTDFANVEQVYKTVLNGPPANRAYVVAT
ncbi:MAG: hypothetical protein ACI9UU_000283 [Candidatus Azotimanducaceae bacterium]|jgi:hypothetical protein